MVPTLILVSKSVFLAAYLSHPNANAGHNSIILMIEAQSRYLNALVSEVIRSKQQGKTLALMPTPEALKEYNDRLQAILRKSSFADPKCNSWYKRDDGVITNNWSGTVVEYQQYLSQVQWKDYIAKGSGSHLVKNKGPTQIGRVHEEPYLSNTSLLAGAASLLAVGGYIVTRTKLQKAR